MKLRSGKLIQQLSTFNFNKDLFEEERKHLNHKILNK